MTSKEILNLYNSSKIIETDEELYRVFRNRDKSLPIAFDTETTGLDFHEKSWLYMNEETQMEMSFPYIFGISMCIISDGIPYLLWALWNSSKYATACDILAEQDMKTAHGAKYDLRVCEKNGINVAPTVDDTYTMSRIYYDRRRKHSLKDLTEFICPELSQWGDPIKEETARLEKKYSKKKGYPKGYVNYSFIENAIMASYSMLDSFMALILWKWLDERAIWR